MDIGERLLTIPEAAERLIVSKLFLYRHIAKGTLPHLRLPGGTKGMIRIRESDLKQWVLQHT